MELLNNLNLNNNILKNNMQDNFLESFLGKSINSAIDIGIRTLLPDYIDDQIINIKDNLLKYGLEDGIKECVKNAISYGKSAIGIITGNFENIKQMQDAVSSGGIIDGMSNLIDFALVQVNKAGIIKNDILNKVKKGKNIILNNIEKNIEKSFLNQFESLDRVKDYIDKWREGFNNKDITYMNKYYSKIEKELNVLAPLEDLLNEVKEIKNLHMLIKNNGNNFELSKNQLELAGKLIN